MANLNAIIAGGQNNRIKAQNYNIKMIHYSKLVPSKLQNRKERRIEEFADMLELAGEIKQPLLVRNRIGDTYEVIAGHRRRLAAIYNVERKGLQQFAYLPCKVESTDDVDTEINLITTNISIDQLTDMEKVDAVMRLKALLPKQKGTENIKGRELRRRIADQMHMSPTKVGQLEHIGNNLTEGGKQALQENRITVSVADALASYPLDKQEELLKEKDLSLNKIKEIKKQEKKSYGECNKSCNGITNAQDILKEDEPSLTPKWFVSNYCKSCHSSTLDKLIEICNSYEKNAERAKKVQEYLSPYGYSGGNSPGFLYTFRGFAKGVEFEKDKQKVDLTYIQFVKIMEELYGPWKCLNLEDKSVEEKAEPEFDLIAVKYTLAENERVLNNYLEIGLTPEIRKQRIIVAGLKCLVDKMYGEL